MDDRARRFVQLGVLGTALEDPAEQDVLINYFIRSLLPLEATIADLIFIELEKQLLVGPGSTFQTISAENKIALDAISVFLEKTFGAEWKKKDEGS